MFSEFCELICVSENFLKLSIGGAVLKTSPKHPMENFKDFFETHFDSKHSEKIHVLLGCNFQKLSIFARLSPKSIVVSEKLYKNIHAKYKSDW